MKNQFLTAAALSLTLCGYSQNAPTIDAAYFDEPGPFCHNGGSKTLIIEVTDIDGDVIVIDDILFTNGYLTNFINPAPPTIIGNTYTFEYIVEMNSGFPPPVDGVVTEDIYIQMIDDESLVDDTTLTGIQVNGEIFVEFNALPEFCSNGLPYDLSATVNITGGVFTWGSNFSPEEFSTTSTFDPKKAYAYYIESGGDYFEVLYEVTNVNGCIGSTYASIDFNSAPDASISEGSSTCGSATGTALASVFGGQAPYDVYWSTGYSETGIFSTSQITNLSSGVYYLNIVDDLGCKQVVKANISDSDISVSPTISASRCAGIPGSVNLAITPTTGSVDDIFWSNGQTTANMLASPGEYSVHVHTTANCNFFGTYEIEDSTLKVKLDDYYPNSNCLSTPNGAFYITTSGGIGTYTWDWVKGGSTVWTNESLINADGGLYTCTVEDGNGCSLTWSKTLENYSNVWLTTDQITKPTCGNSNGSIDIEVNDFGDVPTFYEWSNGATSEDLTGIPVGNYTLTYTDQSGCTNYLTVNLQNEKPYQPTICLLTVDTSLIYNMVVWEKDVTQPVSAFNIYRETSTFGQFEKIVTRPYALESFFQDNDASPVDRSWRYFMTTVDACGTESYGSFVHKTIHVVSSTSDGTNYDIHWDDYEGISYTTIDVFRHDDVNGWTNAANLPYGTNVYSEAPLIVAGLDYMVSFNLTDDCSSTKAQDHNSSRSNKTASVFNSGGSTAQIQDEDLGLISIYPNPANEMLTLHVDNPELFQYYEVTDLNGKVVATGTIMTNNTNIDLFSMEAGVYMIRLVSDEKIVVNKFVKN